VGKICLSYWPNVIHTSATPGVPAVTISIPLVSPIGTSALIGVVVPTAAVAEYKIFGVPSLLLIVIVQAVPALLTATVTV
jgi:hypothetical protein